MCRVPEAGKLTGMLGSTREKKRLTKGKQSDAIDLIVYPANKSLHFDPVYLLQLACPTSFIAIQKDSIYNLEQRGENGVPQEQRIYTLNQAPAGFLLFHLEHRPGAQGWWLNKDLLPPKIPWYPKRLTAILGIRNKLNFSMSPLSGRAVKSSQPSRLAEVSHPVVMEGGKECLSTEGYGCADK